MKKLSLYALALIASMSLVITEAEAKRLGGGGSIGMQRQMSAPPSRAPAATPSPTPSTPASATAPARAATPATAPQTGRSWMGPLAGLAAGIGLAALASHFGFGEELASFMMLAMIGVAVMMLVGYFMRKRAVGQQGALAGAGGNARGFQYAAAEPQLATHSFEAVTPVSHATPAGGGNVPADFDVAGFVRNAKVHYIRLQAANDAGNLDDIREFTTPEMFAEIKLAISERGSAAQETNVLQIDAEVLEVIEEGNRYIASVRYTGQISEERGQAMPVDEIWHLVKSREGKGGWLLAGIQQLQ